MVRQLRRLVAALCALATLPAFAAAQATGTIAGRVTDRASGTPVSNAQVFIVGTQRGSRTDENGQYRIVGVPAGTAQVRAMRIGYESATQPVTVTDGGTAELNFALATAAVQLDVVISTATGEQQRARETGASVGKIGVDSLNLAPVTNFSEVLSSRTAGVTVMSAGGTTGNGSRIRIRGSNSVSLSNDPLIIIDGVRAYNAANSTSIGVGGQQPSRFNDIDPDQIESIEVIKGPAAAALYGTAAANGVIQITTKRGRSGATNWTAHSEYGSINDETTYPTNYMSWGGGAPYCILPEQGAGSCTVDSVQHFNPLEQASPFRQGYRAAYGLSAAGGGEKSQYYLSGDFENEQGVYEPNKLKRTNVRANLHSQLASNFDVSVNTGFLNSTLGRPQNDNNSAGLVSGGLLGAAEFNDSTWGYFFTRPSKLFQLATTQDVQRFTGGLTANYHPLSWLSATGTYGLDYTNRYDWFFVAPGIFNPNTEDPDLAQGQRQSNPYQIWNYTANASATARYSPLSTLATTTTLGVQYSRAFLHGTEAFGQKITPGVTSLKGASALYAVDENTTDNVTLGYLASEQLAWQDRVFLTGSVRTDNNSAFGVDFGNVIYPAASLSWVVGEEPWFPQTPFVSALRLRTAYGASGQQPSFRDAQTYFSPAAVRYNGEDVAGITIGGTGNPDLKPEKSTEFEGGFDLDVLDARAHLEFTYYTKTTRDALVARRLPPSAGLTRTRFDNLGEVKNSGIEGLLNATIVRTDPVQLDFTASLSTNKNRVVNLGEGVKPIIFGLGGNTQRHQNGYPLGGYWQTPYTYADANNDGIIEPDEVTLGDSAVYLGTPFPTREVSLSPRLTLFKNLQVGALFDYRGGMKLYNGTEDFRCSFTLTCAAMNNPSTPLWDQARAVADAYYGTVAGYIEDASFWKLRELTVTLDAPKAWARRANVQGISLTLAGRNLHTWTNYTGFDPEVNVSAQLNFNQADFLTQPPVRYYTARIDVKW